MFGSVLNSRAALAAWALGLALCLPAVLGLGARAQAQVGGSMVGTWYGELAKTETISGQLVNHRRWLRILRTDGTYTIIFRYYYNNRLVVENVDRGVWGHQGRVYWTECRSAMRAGRPVPCSSRWQYDIHRLDAREMAYTNQTTGEHFVVTRVADDYRLP